MTLRRAMALLALATFLWCLPGIGVRATRGAHVAVDEPQYLLSATSLAEDLDLDISDELASGRWRSYHESRLPVQTKALDGGRRVSPHDPLLPVLLAGPVAVGGLVAGETGRWVGAKVALAAMAAALAASLLWVAVRRLDAPLGTSWLVVACFAGAAPLAVYGTQLYPELPAALVVTLGVGAALGAPGPRSALGVGLAVTALPWLSVKYAPVAAALAAVVLWRLHAAGRTRLAVVTAAALGLSGVLFAVGHLLVYGGLTPYAAGDHFTSGELTVAGDDPDYWGRSRRLVGLLVDRDFGLLAWQPAWLLAVPAIGALLRRRPPSWPLLLLPLLAGWLTATFVALTMHGFWWPGRQTVVVLPLAVLAVVWWAAPRRAVRALLVAGVLAGAANWWWLVADGLTGRITWVTEVSRTGAPVHRVLRPLLPDLRRPGSADDVGLALWTLAVVALVALGWWSVGRGVGGGARRDQDATGGERTDADRAILDLDGHRPVG